MSQQNQIQRVAADKLEPFRQALAAQEDNFRRALPSTVAKYLTPERIIKMTLSAISRSPQLLLCTRESILRSVMDASSLGLEPGGPLGQAYMVPFKNNKKDAQGNWIETMEAQLIIGYRGCIALARRSGEIQSVNANVIYSRDRFDVNLAESIVEHRPYMPPMPTPGEAEANGMDPIDLMHRGQAVAVYSVAHFVGGGRHVDFMTIGDVDRIRLRSKSHKNGPWVTDYDEMARKTVVRRAAKYWPLSTELAQAFEVDGDDDVSVSPYGRPGRELPAPTVVPSAADEHEAAASEGSGEDVPPAEDYSNVGPPPMTSEDGEAPAESKTGRIAQRLRTQQPPAYRARTRG